jgi:hypothetical protein
MTGRDIVDVEFNDRQLPNIHLPMDIINIIALIRDNKSTTYYRLLLAIPRFGRATLDRVKQLRWQSHFTTQTVIMEPEGAHQEWWLNGRRHRIDGPAIIETDGYNHWYLHGKRYRIDMPATDKYLIQQMWFRDGALHGQCSETGTAEPAIVLTGRDGNVEKHWYENGILHRVDGPAIIYGDGNVEYWINGVQHTKHEYESQITQ